MLSDNEVCACMTITDKSGRQTFPKRTQYTAGQLPCRKRVERSIRIISLMSLRQLCKEAEASWQRRLPLLSLSALKPVPIAEGEHGRPGLLPCISLKRARNGYLKSALKRARKSFLEAFPVAFPVALPALPFEKKRGLAAQLPGRALAQGSPPAAKSAAKPLPSQGRYFSKAVKMLVFFCFSRKLVLTVLDLQRGCLSRFVAVRKPLFCPLGKAFNAAVLSFPF